MASRAAAPGAQPGEAFVARRTLRSRILLTTLLITGLAVVGFGVPLGIALSHVEHDRVILRMEREASEVVAVVPDESLVHGGQLRIPNPVLGARDADDASMVVGAYGPSGQRLAGAGPIHSSAAAAAIAAGHESVSTEAGQIVVTLPLSADKPSAAAVRVAESLGDTRQDTVTTWLLMGALGVGVLLLAGLAAFLLSRRLTKPLDALAQGARLLGEGDFTVRTARAGLREIDAVGASLDVTAQRLGDLLERERAFSSNASHQIRTPLAALRLNLETLPPGHDEQSTRVIRETVGQLDRLESTVNQLLALTRDVETTQGRLDLPELLDELSTKWRTPAQRASRALRVTHDDDLPDVRASAASLTHVLDVLLENALQHGAGEIDVRARQAGRGVAIDVHDDGPGIAGDPEAVFKRRSGSAHGHGIGLALARSLVEADGGRLELTFAGPGPVFSVVLPSSRGDTPNTANPATSATHAQATP
jgi:signal transduction histidine kinase